MQRSVGGDPGVGSGSTAHHCGFSLRKRRMDTSEVGAGEFEIEGDELSSGPLALRRCSTNTYLSQTLMYALPTQIGNRSEQLGLLTSSWPLVHGEYQINAPPSMRDTVERTLFPDMTAVPPKH